MPSTLEKTNLCKNQLIQACCLKINVDQLHFQGVKFISKMNEELGYVDAVLLAQGQPVRGTSRAQRQDQKRKPDQTSVCCSLSHHRLGNEKLGFYPKSLKISFVALFSYRQNESFPLNLSATFLKARAKEALWGYRVPVSIKSPVAPLKMAILTNLRLQRSLAL